MVQWASSSYTSDQQLAVLKSEVRIEDFLYEIIDGSTGNSKGYFTDILPGGKISYGYLNDIKRTATFRIAENLSDSFSRINLLKDQIQVYCTFTFIDQAKGNQTLTYPVGRFVLSSSSRQVQSGDVIYRDVSAYDLSKVLADDTISSRLEVPSGTNVITAVQTQLQAAGITRINLDSQTATTSTTRSWEIGTSRLKIINELLDLIGRGSLYFDGLGVATSRKYIAPGDRSADISYQTDNMSVLTPDFSAEIDLSSIPNQWTFVYSQPDATPLVATYQNTSTSSPTSIPNRGRVIAYYSNENEDATDVASLYDKAKKKAAEDSQVYETVSVATLNMPIHGENEIVYLYHSEGMSQGFNYSETAWDMNLKAGGTMNHTLRRAVSVAPSS